MSEMSTAEQAPAETPKALAPAAKPREKLVKIRLPRTRENQEDVFVSVNNRTWLIKRGADVEVPECVVEVLRNQELMLEECMLFESNARNAGRNK